MIYLKKIFFSTTISLIFSLGYYLGLYINSEICYLRTLVYKTTEKIKLMNDKYDLLLSEFTHLKHNLTNDKEMRCFIDCESQTIVDKNIEHINENIEHINKNIDEKINEYDHDHEYDILDKNTTSPDMKIKIRGNSISNILNKFF